MTHLLSLLAGANVRLIRAPSLAVVTTNVADGGGSVSGVPGCEGQEQGTRVTNNLGYVKSLKV